MKRFLSCILAAMMLLSVLTGCKNETPDNTTAPAETQSAEEQAVLKILTIGNSHSLDATNLLYEVFQKEAPDKEVVLGTLYYSGCNMHQHAKFISENQSVYQYYKNADGNWTVLNSATVEYALKDEQWDIVVMQQMNHRVGMEGDYVASDFKTVIDHIYANQKVKPTLAFHMTWTNPDDYAMYLDDNAPLKNPDPADWRKTHQNNFGNAEGKYDQGLQYQEIVKNVQKYLVDSTEFLGENYYEFIIPVATAIEYAQDVQERPQTQLYRDYTHLNDYGRLIAAYLWYARIMGLSAIEQVHVSAIPAALHHRSSEYPMIPDYAIDEEMKADLMECVNWALTHPYELPAK